MTWGFMGVGEVYVNRMCTPCDSAPRGDLIRGEERGDVALLGHRDEAANLGEGHRAEA